MHSGKADQPVFQDLEKMAFYIKNLIAGGEGQELDFKYHVVSAAKIAKTLVAFANTQGGRLLIGVKDNGVVIGVSSDEEIYMIELAAEKYCQPEVKVEVQDWTVDGKTVLEVIVPPSAEKPHYAKDETGRWLVYIRKDDENLLADKVLVEVYKRRKKKKETVIKYERPEQLLLDHLRTNKQITFAGFCQLAHIPSRLAERILVNLVSVGIIEVEMTPRGNFFKLGKTAMAG